MKKLLILFICQFVVIYAFSQSIDNGWVYGGSGVQRATQTYIDRTGNRYQVIEFADNFVIDSCGYPITVRKDSVNTKYLTPLAIIKFDSSGKYLYHLRLQSFGFTRNNLDIKFTTSNDIVICFYFPQYDTIDLVDSKGILFKKIIPSFNRNVIGGIDNLALLVCKLNPNGQYVWANTIAREKLPINRIQMYFGSFVLSKTDEIIVSFPNIRSDTTTLHDTISVTNNVNQKSLFLVNTKYLLLRFSSSGNLLSLKEPFKNMFLHNHSDSLFDIKVINMITDGSDIYGIFRFRISKLDSIKKAMNDPLNIGNYNLLVKMNEQDSITWVKPISRELIPHYYQLNKFDYDTIKQEIAIAIPYNPSIYEFLFNPLYSTAFSGAYISKIDRNGNILFESSINGNDAIKTIVSLNYNYFDRHLYLIGNTNGNDMELQKFLPTNNLGWPMAFIAKLDSLNKIVIAKPIISDNNRMSSSIVLNQFKIGSPIYDHCGKTYISGWFSDSISLPCRSLKATIETDSWGTPLTDGFVLISNPCVYKDTSVCFQLTSPSGRHVWDSTYTYSDTITNAFGCDSIVFLNVKILSSKSTIDTFVCKPLKSISGRFIWDSTGTYFDTIPNVFGCDSIITFNLTIKSNKLNIDSIVQYRLLSPSNKFIWDSSGVYCDTLINRYGCDSVLLINLKVLSNKFTIDTFNCHPISLISRSEFITQSGTFYDTIPNSIGGDSLLTIRFVLGSRQSSIDTTFCSHIVSPSSKYIYTQSGTYTDTLLNSVLCDSIITVKYTRTATSDTLVYTSCDSLLTPSGNRFVFTTGIYYDTLTTFNGCDSILFIYFTKLTSYSILTFSICDSLISPSGKYIYATNGIFKDTLTNINGCDSIITIKIIKSDKNLTVTKSNDIDCNNPYSILNVNGDGLFNFIWSPNEGIDYTNDIRVIAKPKNDIQYIVTALDSLGCLYSDSIFIKVNSNDSLGFFPNVFTPNSDVINDCIPLNSITELDKINFVVFNRWGIKVFESTDTKECWQGHSNNGRELSEGVYYYILKGLTVCGNNISLHGTITIIR